MIDATQRTGLGRLEAVSDELNFVETHAGSKLNTDHIRSR
jgi:hypothetical protein